MLYICWNTYPLNVNRGWCAVELVARVILQMQRPFKTMHKSKAHRRSEHFTVAKKNLVNNCIQFSANESIQVLAFVSAHVLERNSAPHVCNSVLAKRGVGTSANVPLKGCGSSRTIMSHVWVCTSLGGGLMKRIIAKSPSEGCSVWCRHLMAVV